MTVMSLEELRKLDVRDVDPETLPDIKDIHIDPSLPPEQRMASVLRHERESLFSGSQDLLQRRGPASDAPGGLPGALIIGLLNQQSRPRQKFRLDNLNDFCYTGNGSNQNSSVKTLSDRSGFCRNTRLGG